MNNLARTTRLLNVMEKLTIVVTSLAAEVETLKAQMTATKNELRSLRAKLDEVPPQHPGFYTHPTRTQNPYPPPYEITCSSTVNGSTVTS